MQRSSRKPTKRLRTPKVASVEGKAKAVRKRKLSKSPKGVSIVDEHVTKTRRTLSDSESLPNKQVDKDKTTEETGVDSISVLPLEQDIQGSCLLFLKKKQVVAIRGKAELEILQGNVDVMGFKTKTDQQTYQIFSPSCSSLLTIEECSTTDSSQSTAVKDFLVSQHPHLKKQAIASAQKAASVLLIKKVNDSEAEHVCRYKEYRDIFNATDAKESNPEKHISTEQKLNNVTNVLGFSLVDANAERNSIYKEPEEWRNIINNINVVSSENGDKSPSILVCGGKGVGKSSFARYVINSLLNSCSEVCYLECDAGQTEFTPPAVLSLTHITKPIFGPPFTHLKWPEKAHFFGDLSPKDNPNFYIDCINSLYQYYQEICVNDRDIPLVINTQGWVKGMGVPLLVDVIRVTKPSHIVQMNFPLTTKNLPTITSDFLDHSPGWSRPIERPDQNAMLGDSIDNLSTKDEDRSEDNVASLSQPVIFQLETCTVEDPGSGSRFRPSDHRTMSLLAYFSRVHENQSNNEPTSKGPTSKGPTPITHCLPYKVPWSHVAVHVIHTKVPRSQVLVSLNASIVGLAISPHSMIEAHDKSSNDIPMFLKETPIVDCIGLGIIRNIDPVNKLFYILTPVPLDKLRRVNTLLKGNLELPATMLLKERQPGSPYVSSEFSFDIRGAGARKVRYNLQRKKFNTP